MFDSSFPLPLSTGKHTFAIDEFAKIQCNCKQTKNWTTLYSLLAQKIQYLYSLFSKTIKIPIQTNPSRVAKNYPGESSWNHKRLLVFEVLYEVYNTCWYIKRNSNWYRILSSIQPLHRYIDIFKIFTLTALKFVLQSKTAFHRKLIKFKY